jgi:hypothetical protein
MSRPDRGKRFPWGPVSLAAALATAAYGTQYIPHNPHGYSNSPESQRGVPNYPVAPLESGAPDPEADATFPAKAKRVGQQVCAIIFVDRGKHEVIINPVLDEKWILPATLASADPAGVEFTSALPRNNNEAYNLDGRPTSTGEMTNDCPEEEVSLLQVKDPDTHKKSYVLGSPNTTLSDGDEVNLSPTAAVENDLVHYEAHMSDAQIEDFLSGL